MNFENHFNYNCEISLDTGETYKVFGSWLHNQQLDTWLNWCCSVGQTRLVIDENFDVYSGECLNDSLGNLFDQWALLANGTICRQNRCSGCVDDLVAEKNA